MNPNENFIARVSGHSLQTLEAMGEEDLSCWLTQRMRREWLDLPLSWRQDETPNDFVVFAYRRTRDEGFRRRLKEAILDALRAMARAGSLAEEPAAEELTNLAELAQELDLRNAADILGVLAADRLIHRRGPEMSPTVESSVLF